MKKENFLEVTALPKQPEDWTFIADGTLWQHCGLEARRSPNHKEILIDNCNHTGRKDLVTSGSENGKGAIKCMLEFGWNLTGKKQTMRRAENGLNENIFGWILGKEVKQWMQEEVGEYEEKLI